MSLFWVILLDLLLVYFFFGSDLVAWFTPKKLRPRRQFRSDYKGFRSLVHRNRDLLTQHQLAACGNLLADYSSRLKSGEAITQEEARKYSDRLGATVKTLPMPRRHPSVRNWVETIVVSAGVAFAIRSLLFSPFSIPTGSMQPTLYGIHFVGQEAPAAHRALRQAFDYLNYSKRYVRHVAPAEGSLDFLSVRAAKAMPLFPASEIDFVPATGGKIPLRIPASLVDTQKTILELYGEKLREAARDNFPAFMAGARPTLHFQRGEVLFNGAMESGDHLFVNRLSLAFREPYRGQVMVFNTRGITYNDQPLSGDFYIKRLVGLPGDTLKILNRTVWIRPAGEAEFRPLGEKDAPGFAKIYSMADGYRGHAALREANYLRAEGEEYTVPEEHYFMLGDNTENSLDSRFWGSVPRENLVGSPCLVWWPFSRRFGFVDRPPASAR